MLHMIGHALLGLLIGVVAKLLIPGHDPGGIIVTALIGLVGGAVGGWIGRALAGIGKESRPASGCRSLARWSSSCSIGSLSDRPVFVRSIERIT